MRKIGAHRINNIQTSTTASRIVDLHYENLNIRGIWDRKRVERLCSCTRFTIGELSSLIGYEHRFFERNLNCGRLSLPVCILLTLIENHTIGHLVPDAIPDLLNFFPDDGRPEGTESEELHEQSAS